MPVILSLAASVKKGSERKNFKSMLSYGEQSAPMRKNVSIEEVGNATAFMCSDLASGITGEIIYVDGGYHIVGMNMPENA